MVSLRASELQALLGKAITPAELEERLPLLGCTVERVEGDVVEVEFFPNRPDQYSIEGVARSLRAFLGIRPGLSTYRVSPSGVAFNVDPSVESVRPFVVGGIVRGIELSDGVLRSLIDLQEKLHTTLGRRRSKVAVGIHDLDKVTPPFTYRAVGPHEVRFVPLGMDRPMDLGEILRDHEKGREFAPLLQGKDRYPIIQDAKEQVLSFPPVINGTVTLLTEATRNLFVDVTGTNAGAVAMTLNIIMTALAERGGRLASVLMKSPGGEARSPDLRPRAAGLDLAFANGLLGISIGAEEAKEAMERMGYGATARGRRLSLRVPAYRADILHPVDFVEDLAIGYGVDRFPRTLPKANTVGATAALDDLRRQVRDVMIGYGFQEVNTLELVPKTMPFSSPEPRTPVANPISEETAVVRSALLPSVLDILRLNKQRDLPQRIFEIADVAIEGKNRMHLAAAVIDSRAGFTDIKSLVQGLARDVGVGVEVEGREDPNFIPGRAANWVLKGEAIGYFGEVHPRVISQYELGYPVVALEMEVGLIIPEDRTAQRE